MSQTTGFTWQRLRTNVHNEQTLYGRHLPRPALARLSYNSPNVTDVAVRTDDKRHVMEQRLSRQTCLEIDNRNMVTKAEQHSYNNIPNKHNSMVQGVLVALHICLFSPFSNNKDSFYKTLPFIPCCFLLVHVFTPPPPLCTFHSSIAQHL